MSLSLIIKWGGQEYTITSLSEEDTVLDLKQSLKGLTGVLPERQKLLGLKMKGKPADDDVKLGALKLKPNTKIMMMGTREESLEDVLGPPPDNDDVVNDFDIEEEVVEVENREENLLKISRRVKEYKVEILNPPREGKKLLVLDVDYTLFDHRSCAETGVELMRPYLHEFLTSAYEDYDIVIWSATNMKWIEAKMKELGVSTNANYKITFMLDSAAMITVHTPRRGLIDVKPLGVIWGKFSEYYSKKNTIMFDDIGRNFLMNPQNGLKIRPFMKAHLNRDKDKELLKLTQYLKEIAKLDDFLELNHKHWESLHNRGTIDDINLGGVCLDSRDTRFASGVEEEPDLIGLFISTLFYLLQDQALDWELDLSRSFQSTECRARQLGMNDASQAGQ
ncbi:hypothetical protein HGM15179_004824 [Zosterops borbonicus]|nr:hypothetical protein HGM15179_004824 [Zosterops borbonicus]